MGNMFENIHQELWEAERKEVMNKLPEQVFIETINGIPLTVQTQLNDEILIRVGGKNAFLSRKATKKLAATLIDYLKRSSNITTQ